MQFHTSRKGTPIERNVAPGGEFPNPAKMLARFTVFKSPAAEPLSIFRRALRKQTLQKKGGDH
jgi:hypothetical protein